MAGSSKLAMADEHHRHVAQHRDVTSEVSPRVATGGTRRQQDRAPCELQEQQDLVVLTLNWQYYASFPKDTAEAHRRLSEIVSAEPRPDVICVQEGLDGRDELAAVGYRRLISSHSEAQTLGDMVYNHAGTLAGVSANAHDKLLVNELYVREEGPAWEVVEAGVLRTASQLSLVGGGDGVEGPLATRSAVWAKLRPIGQPDSPCTIVLNTHLSGGRFEDQFFVQQLAQERREQVDRSLEFFKSIAGPEDLGILVGDFNATTDDRADGPVRGYFNSAIVSSARVREDAAKAGLSTTALEANFRAYMAAPFAALQHHGWELAYKQDDVGPTSAFGHCVDHMATNRVVPARAEVFQTTLQRFGGSPPAPGFVPLTDHNAVKVTFAAPAAPRAAPSPPRVPAAATSEEAEPCLARFVWTAFWRAARTSLQISNSWIGCGLPMEMALSGSRFSVAPAAGIAKGRARPQQN